MFFFRNPWTQYKTVLNSNPIEDYGQIDAVAVDYVELICVNDLPSFLLFLFFLHGTLRCCKHWAIVFCLLFSRPRHGRRWKGEISTLAQGRTKWAKNQRKYKIKGERVHRDTNKPQNNHETFFNFDTFLRVVVRSYYCTRVRCSFVILSAAGKIRPLCIYLLIRQTLVCPICATLSFSIYLLACALRVHIHTTYIRTDFFNLFLFASARCLTVAERWRSYPLKKLGGEIQGKTNKNSRHLFLILFFNTKQGGVSLSIFFLGEKINYEWVSGFP